MKESDFCETLILISKSRLSRKTLVSFSISTLNFFIKTLILILNYHSQTLENLRVKRCNSSTSLLHFSVKSNISLNFDASIVKILMVKVILQCTLILNQTHILEDSRISYQISNLFFPQNSHSQLSIFFPELSFSFSTLKNFLEKSHSRSRLSVNLLSQKSGPIYAFIRGSDLDYIQFYKSG